MGIAVRSRVVSVHLGCAHLKGRLPGELDRLIVPKAHAEKGEADGESRRLSKQFHDLLVIAISQRHAATTAQTAGAVTSSGARCANCRFTASGTRTGHLDHATHTYLRVEEYREERWRSSEEVVALSESSAVHSIPDL